MLHWHGHKPLVIDPAGRQRYQIVGNNLFNKHDTSPLLLLVFPAHVKAQIYLRVATVKGHRNTQYSDAKKLQSDNTDQASAFPLVK